MWNYPGLIGTCASPHIAVTLADHEANVFISLILCGCILMLRIYLKHLYMLQTNDIAM
jgi:hypothetical protein